MMMGGCVLVACFLFMLCLQCTAKTSDVGLRRYRPCVHMGCPLVEQGWRKNTPLLYIERDIKFAEIHFGNLPGVKIFSSPKIFIAPTKSGGKLLCASILFGPQRFVFYPRPARPNHRKSTPAEFTIPRFRRGDE